MMRLTHRQEIYFEKIIDVVVIEQTETYKREKSKAGLLFQNSLLNPSVILTGGDMEPSGTIYTFSITYTDHSKDIVKAESGTAACDRLLQLALDFNNNHSVEEVDAPKLGKNQLPQGIYIIGKDIPEGTYDFKHIWGHGNIQLFDSKETLVGNCKFFEWMGNKETYEKKTCVHVECRNGWYLHVNGNVIIEISRSQKINLDL